MLASTNKGCLPPGGVGGKWSNIKMASTVKRMLRGRAGTTANRGWSKLAGRILCVEADGENVAVKGCGFGAGGGVTWVRALGWRSSGCRLDSLSTVAGSRHPATAPRPLPSV